MKTKDLGLPIFYKKYPEYFDNPNQNDQKNQEVEKLLKKYKAQNIFDMTCGTGSQVFYLADRGYTISGSDFSPKLIKIAKKKVSEKNLLINFIDGDMRSLQAGKFDAVITIDNSIGHLVKEDFQIALKNIRNNLKDNGIYIFDILDIESMTDEVILADNKRMTRKTVFDDGTEIVNKIKSEIDRTKGLFIANNDFSIFKKSGEVENIKNNSSLQIYTSEELKKILEKNGFKVLEQNKVSTFSFKKDPSGYAILTVAQKV